MRIADANVSAYHLGMIPWHSERPCRLSLVVLALFCLLLILTMPVTGQESNSELSPAAEAAWAAAQEAQQQKDYAKAGQEYRKVTRLAPGFAEAFMNLGLVDELQNHRSDAIAMFEEAVQLKPGLAGAQFFLGVDYCKLGEARRAIPHLEAAVRARPNLPDAWSWLASAYQQTGQISRQLDTLQAGLRANPGSIDLLYLQGQAYEQLGKSAVERIQQKDPQSTFLEQLLAENYAASGYLSVAMWHLQNALKETPGRAGLHVALAEVLLHAGNLKRAQDEIAAELEIAPHSLRSMVRRGEVELLQGDVPRAMADWSQALALDPTRCEVILGVRELGFGDTSQEKLPDDLRAQLSRLRGQLETQDTPANRLALAFISTQEGDAKAAAGAIDSGKSDAAKPTFGCTAPQWQSWLVNDLFQPVAACTTLILKQPSAAPLRLEIARALYETGHPDRALAALEGLPALQADSPEALYWKSRCYNRLALAAYLRLFEVDADSYRAHQVLGDMEDLRGEDAKAIAEYETALTKRPTLPNLHYQIGHLEWKSYKTEDARKQFQAELEINPRHAGALFDLGSTYLREHQPDKALVYFKRVYDLDSKYPDLHDFMGIAYSQLNRYAEAEKELQIAAPGDKDGSIHYQLARVYTALGKSSDAQKEFALSNQLLVATHRANEERVERIAEAEAALKQP
jgi:tetratricopeptide (TPR) repeat protein